jgi:response regulator RpfG family c-di-GMP phosphodiesterase
MPPDRRARILVIDDEEYICRIVVESLGEADHDIASFTDPKQAIEYLATNPVDLVLTDLMMGESSGLQVLETALENHPDAIIVLMTAHPTVQTAISVLKRGAYDFLIKPFKLELLNQTVRRGLAHQKVVRDNLSLKGQVQFLKVANAFFGSGMELDDYLEMVLRSCNTELSAQASAILEVDPASGQIVREVVESTDETATNEVLNTQLLDQFSGKRSSAPRVISEPVTVDGRRRYRVTISQPIMVRRTLHGVINVMIISRQDSIPAGQMDILSLLAGSAASAMANQKLYRDLQQSYFQAIRALTNSIEARDNYTAGHTDRVTRLAELVARQLSWTEKQVYTLRIGCTLHDIGKIGVPDAILNKTGPLTDNERKRMEKHPQLGLRIIRGIDLFKPSIPYILAHHERFDGAGYPKGLKGKEIPIEGRLLAVVDTFDAVMSDRPYRGGATVEVAVGELVGNAGTQFDPKLVDAFLAVLSSEVIDLAELYGRELDLSVLNQKVISQTAPV